MTSMTNKNILIICPVFHGYEERIISCIKQSRKYANLYLIKDTPLKSEKIYLTIKNLMPKISTYLLKWHNKKILRFVKSNEVDVFFIIKGAYLSDETVSLIQKEFPKVKIVFYNWDSLKNNPSANDLLKLIGDSYTFDFNDAQTEKRLKYLPLFYSFDQLPMKEYVNKDIDFLFVGGFSLERIPILLKIKNLCEKEGWNILLYLYVPYGVYLKYWSKMHAYKKYISFKTLKYEDYYTLVRRAKVVIDIANSGQTGLTIRSIEALSQNCHLITTNKRIIEMDFYKDSNITIVKPDEINSTILKAAFEKKFDSNCKSSIYSTKEWLEQMAII